MEKKLYKPYLKNYDLMIAQAYCQVLSLIWLKNFMKLNVNVDILIKNAKHMKLNAKTVSAALNTKTLKMI